MCPYDTRNNNRDLRNSWKRQETEHLLGSIPMTQADLRALFDFLDREDAPPCDHTLRETLVFLRQRGVGPERVVPWLREHGGFCDCEVIGNVEEIFGEIIER